MTKVVATITKSMSDPSSPAAARAFRAASAPKVEEVSPGPLTRRSWMPVRWTIHSSLVSTLFANSSFVTIREGTALPEPTTTARLRPTAGKSERRRTPMRPSALRRRS